MSKRDDQRGQIVEGAAKHLLSNGPPPPPFGRIEETAGISRQLVRYYFDDADDLLLAVCDHLASAYRMALIGGVETLAGAKRLHFIFDFYFDLVADLPKPRDDQAYDAMFAFAAGSPRIRDNLRAQYTLLGQVLQLEIKMQYPELSLEDCAEISYLFVCIMYGHWKMVASLGLGEDHKLISRRAIDRIIASYAAGDEAGAHPIRTWGAA